MSSLLVQLRWLHAVDRLEAMIPPREIERAPGGGGASGATGYRIIARCAVADFVLVVGVVRD